MIDTIIFIMIGIAAAYIVYRIVKKDLKEGRCVGCAYANKCKNKENCLKNYREKNK